MAIDTKANAINPSAPMNVIPHHMADQAGKSRGSPFDRYYNGILQAKALPEQPTPKHGWWNVVFPRPLRDGLVFAKGQYSDITAAVVSLFGWRSPAAIVSLVVPAVVAPINRMVRRRTRPHVADECHEISAPPIADRNPLRAITSERIVLGVMASGNHGLPRVVKRVPRQAMFGRDFAHVLARKIPEGAPARSRIATAQIASGGDDRSTTIAQTCPPSGSLVDFFRMFGLNDQSAKADPAKIKKFAHRQMQYHNRYCNAMVEVLCQ